MPRMAGMRIVTPVGIAWHIVLFPEDNQGQETYLLGVHLGSVCIPHVELGIRGMKLSFIYLRHLL